MSFDFAQVLTFKVVQIALSLEAFVTTLIEVSFHPCFRKDLGLKDGKGRTFGVPTNDVGISRLGSFCQKSMQLDGK